MVQSANHLVLAVLLITLAESRSGDLPQPDGAVFQQDVAWSPDGKKLAFSQLPTDGEYRPEIWSVYTVDLANMEIERVATQARNASWSPDGERIAFGCYRDANWEICTADPDGGRVQRLTHDESNDGAPGWSPDGTMIAFHSDRTGASAIHVLALADRTVTRLSGGGGNDYAPAWSPDGRSIVFYRKMGDDADQIWTVTLDGRESRFTRDANHNVYPSYRSDGSIVFASRAPEAESILLVADPGAGGRTALPGIKTFFARFSPDRRLIAFISGRWPRSAIYLADGTGEAIRKIVN